MTKNKVLVLDDDLDWQNRIKDLLEDSGLQAVSENNAKTAHLKILNNAEEFLFAFIDVVLTEKGDDRDGLGFIERLKKSNVKLPCILCSSHLDVELISDIMLDGDYDWIVTIIDKQDFSKRPWRINKAIDKAIAKKKNNSLERTNVMTTPSEQLGIGVLLEGVKFLFAELGRRLEFWRERKGDQATPQKIEIMDRKGTFLKLDDVEMEIVSTVNQDKIQNSLEILKRYNSTLDTYRLEATNPIITPDKKAFLNIEIPRLEKTIIAEGDRLQSLIEESLE